MGEVSAKCTQCKKDLHLSCTQLLLNADDHYCTDCASNLSWEDIELSNDSIHIPRNARLPRTAAQVERYRLNALMILQAKRAMREELQEERPMKQSASNLALLAQLQELKIECKSSR